MTITIIICSLKTQGSGNLCYELLGHHMHVTHAKPTNTHAPDIK